MSRAREHTAFLVKRNKQTMREASHPEPSPTFPFPEPQDALLCLMMALDLLTEPGHCDAHRKLAREWVNHALLLMTGKQLDDMGRE